MVIVVTRISPFITCINGRWRDCKITQVLIKCRAHKKVVLNLNTTVIRQETCQTAEFRNNNKTKKVASHGAARINFTIMIFKAIIKRWLLFIYV